MNEKSRFDALGETVSREELLTRYPFLNDWVVNKEMPYTQVLEGKRLWSAEEKIAVFGGESQVKLNIRRANVSDLILQSCRMGYMGGYEIYRFANLANIRPVPSIGSIYFNALDLEEEDLLESIENLEYISARENNNYWIRIVSGFKTTDTGLRVRVLEREKRSWLPFRLPTFET